MSWSTVLKVIANTTPIESAYNDQHCDSGYAHVSRQAPIMGTRLGYCQAYSASVVN